MNDFFKKLQDNINKNVKGVHASVMANSDIATNRYWIPTPCYDLNRVLSGNLYNGIQSRNLVGIVGPEHSMKSSFAVLCLVEAIKQGKKAVIIDTEGGMSKEFCSRWGLDIEQVYYVYTNVVSEVRSVIGQIRETGEENLIVVVDSLGGLERLKQFSDAAKGEMKEDQGLLQKNIRAMLKILLNVCINQNSIGIVTGHMYGSATSGYDQIGGGKAVKLFPSILIQLYKQQIYEFPNKKGIERGKILGTEIKATTLKNRMYPPFQTATVQLDYLKGVQPYAGILDLAVQAGLIEKAASWYTIGEEKIQGQAAVETLLPDIPNLLDDINTWLENTGYSTTDIKLKEKVEEEKILEK